MFLIGTGAVLLAAGIALIFIGRGRGGQRAAFLKIPYVEVTYAMLITSLIGLGLATMFGGLADMFTA